MTFQYKKVVKLDQFGWTDCELVLNGITFAEAKKWQTDYAKLDPNDPDSAEVVFNMLKAKFISGTALDEKGEKTDIKPEQLDELPIDILLYAIKELSGSDNADF